MYLGDLLYIHFYLFLGCSSCHVMSSLFCLSLSFWLSLSHTHSLLFYYLPSFSCDQNKLKEKMKGNIREVTDEISVELAKKGDEWKVPSKNLSFYFFLEKLHFYVSS